MQKINCCEINISKSEIEREITKQKMIDCVSRSKYGTKIEISSS